MSHPKPPDKHSESLITPSKIGLIKVSLKTSKHLEEKDCTTSLHSSISNNKIPIKIKCPIINKYATVESPPEGKKTILNVRSKKCENNSQAQKLSLTSDQESIAKEKDSEPFWSGRAKVLSQKLWLPTEIDCAVSHLNSSNGCFKSMESNSWFSILQWRENQPMTDNQNWSKISSPSSMYSTVESMVIEDTNQPPKQRTSTLRKSNKPVANLTRRIRLFPNPETKQKLKSWFGCVRKTYNLALSAIKNNEEAINISTLRKSFTNNSKIQRDQLYPYLLETPKHVRDGALTDLVNAFQSNFKKRERDPSFQFEVHYRSKKLEQSILIEADSGARLDSKQRLFHMYPSFLGQPIKYYIRSRNHRQTLVPEINYDCRLILDTRGHYYLNIPCFVEASDKQTGFSKHAWAALDPGVRTFQTIYSPEHGCAFKIGNNDIARIYCLCLTLDRLISRKDRGYSHQTDQKNHENHQSVRRKIKKLRQRIQHLVDEVHWKTIHFLLSNFRNIIIPVFNVQSMVHKKSRKIGHKTVRQMLGWSHYKFRQRLMSSAYKTNSRIFVVGEEYTTQACGYCMHLNKNVGGRKQYCCSQCRLKMDRDLNGARNIFMMNVRYEGERRVLKRR